MTERAPRLDRDRAARAIAEFIAAIGEDVQRPGLARTPQRVAETAAELLGGIGRDPVPMLRAGRIPLPGPSGRRPMGGGAAAPDAGAGSSSEQPVIVRGATFRSMCEHHLLPFTGVVHLAYVPTVHLVGLGRLYELIEIVTTRLTLQERIGDEIVDALMAGLDARGAIVVIEATHGCVTLRGSRQDRGDTVTVSGRGTLADPSGRAEVMSLLHGPDALGGTGSGDGRTTVRDGVVQHRFE